MSVREAFVRLLWQVRWWMAIALLPVVVIAGAGLPYLRMDNAIDVWFVQDDPALLAYDRFQDEFGNDEVVALAVRVPEGIFTAAGLAELRRVSEAAAAVDGIAEVSSLVTLNHVRVDEDWKGDPFEAPPLVVDKVIDGAAPERLAARVAADPLLRGRLVSEDGRTAIVLARMGERREVDVRRDAILAALREAVDAPGHHVPAAGIGVVFSALNVASSRDVAVVGTASYALIFGLLLWIYRRPGPVILTAVVLVAAEIVTLGAMGWAGRKLNAVTLVLPTVVLIIGVADCVHMLGHVGASSWRDRKERAIHGVSDVLLPCLFTSLTTVAGFLALGTAKMQVIRDLGWFAALGVGAAFVFTVVGVLCGLDWEAAEPRPKAAAGLRAWLMRLGDWAVRRRAEALWASGALALAGAWGISRIDVDTWSIDFFYAHHEVRRDSDAIEASYGPYTPLELVVRAPEGSSLRNVEALGALAAWQDRMEADPGVGATRSVVDVVRRLNQVLSDGQPASFRVPPSDDALEQALMLYESDPEARTDDLVDAQWTRARVTVSIPMMSARGMDQTVERLTQLAELPDGLSVEPAGYLPLYVTMMDYVVRSQITSFTTAFIAIFGLLALVFRSVRMTLLAVPGNLLPIFATLGLMGALGIRLDVATVTIAAVVQGLIVDDTTHFLYRYRIALREAGDHAVAVRETLRTTGVPMTTTTVVLVLGFSVLGLASVKSVGWFGLLAAAAMLTAWVGDLILLPALLVALKPKL